MRVYTPALADSFQWSLSDNKSSQVSRTPFSILADLNNTVIWMVPICPLIFTSSSPITKTLGMLPNALFTIGINVIFILISFISMLLLWEFLTPALVDVL